MIKRTSWTLLLAALASTVAASTASATPLPSDANLLSGLAATPATFGVSSYFSSGSVTTPFGPAAGDYGPQNATNGTAGGAGADFVFNPGDGSQRAAITGFNSAVSEILIWSGDLRPLSVTIESSTTSKTSINSSDYETTLVSNASLPGTWSSGGNGYVSFTVNAPVGTQSLYFDFGRGQDTTGNSGFARISELQAFAPVPEPASLVLLGLGALGLLGFARRRRQASASS